MSKLKFLSLNLLLIIVFAALWNIGELLTFGKITPDTFEIILVCVISCGLALIIDTLVYIKKKIKT